MAKQAGGELDKDLAAYRNLMETPSTFEDGFSLRTVFGVIFVAIVMIPTAIYLGLTMGQNLGPAAEWVTIILFADVARRSFKPLKRQELYLLYYVAASLMSFTGGLALSGGFAAQLIWKNYLVHSHIAEALGITEYVSSWVVPDKSSPAVLGRTFLHRDWIVPILLMSFTAVVGRLSWITMGYALFRSTSDVEKLPFPMATVAAAGATALAESGEEKESWRWRVFSIGAMMGMIFGAVYILVPAISGALFNRPIQILPIPWIDLTTRTETVLPAASTGIMTNLGIVITGMVLPFWIVAGSFFAALTHMFLNPVLHHVGMLPHWRRGMGTIMTEYVNSIDFWMSFGIGTALAVATLGFWIAIRSYRRAKAERIASGQTSRASFADLPPGRGDFSVRIALVIFAICSLVNVGLVLLLLKKDLTAKLVFFVFFFALVYTPLISYINARMIGLTGRPIGFPMIRQATFILSGYKGADIWFAPFPMRQYGMAAQRFRAIELTGTKFTSIFKAEALTLPVLFLASFFFWGYIWRYGDPIPNSPAYPFAQKMWFRHCLSSCLMYSATLPGGEAGGENLFFQALKWRYVGGGLAFGLSAFWILSILKMPTMLLYGYVGGLGYLPHQVLPMMLGAVLSRYYFSRLFGEKQWKRYVPVLSAGFFCGMGLIGMVGISVKLLSVCVSSTPW